MSSHCTLTSIIKNTNPILKHVSIQFNSLVRVSRQADELSSSWAWRSAHGPRRNGSPRFKRSLGHPRQQHHQRVHVGSSISPSGCTLSPGMFQTRTFCLLLTFLKRIIESNTLKYCFHASWFLNTSMNNFWTMFYALWRSQPTTMPTGRPSCNTSFYFSHPKV